MTGCDQGAQRQSEVRVAWFRGTDGAELAVRELGAGCPLDLLHGYFSTSIHTWIHTGVASLVAELGHRVIIRDPPGSRPEDRGIGISKIPNDWLVRRLDGQPQHLSEPAWRNVNMLWRDDQSRLRNEGGWAAVRPVTGLRHLQEPGPSRSELPSGVGE